MNNVDNRIVRMNFENDKFERGVKQTMGTLEKLKSSLSFTQEKNNYGELTNAMNTTKFDGLLGAIDNISDRFSTMGIVAMSIISNITDRLTNMGINFVKSMSVDNIASGWSKYEQKVKSVQTIMAAGYNMDEVTEQLEKLNWFTDETSYNFSDMVNNIGKFTAQGIKLEDATTAMEGISTWAAISGQGIGEASRAMYNLSQAIGIGAVKMQDWRSIEMANMATKEFKEQVLQTAVEMGTLKQQTDGTYRIAKNLKEVTIENFSSTLSEGWFSRDVLVNVLKRYGSYADGLNRIYDMMEGRVTTSGIITDVRRYSQGLKLFNNYTDEALELVKELSTQVGSIGERAFSASQEAKTLSEALGSVKDAVSTGWMTTFEYLFGNYEQAKVLWTDLANSLYDIFAESGNQRNALLESWIDLGGRGFFIDGLYALGRAIRNIIDLFRELKDDIFPSLTGLGLVSFTAKFKDWAVALEEMLTNPAEKVKDIESVFEKVKDKGLLDAFGPDVKEAYPLWDRLHRIFKGIAAVGNIIKEIFKGILDFAKQIFTFASPAVYKLLDMAADFGDFLTGISEAVTETDKLNGSLGILGKIAESISNVFKAIKDNSAIKGFFDTLWNGITHVLDSIYEYLSGFDLVELMKTLFNTSVISSIVVVIANFVTGLLNALGSFGNEFGNLVGTIGGIFGKGNGGSFVDTISSFAKSMLILAAALTILSKVDAASLTLSLGAVILLLRQMLGIAKEMSLYSAALSQGSGKQSFLDRITSMFGSKNVSLKGIISFSTGILILSGALKMLSSIDTTNLVVSLGIIETLMFSYQKIITSMNKIEGSGGGKSGLIAFAASVLILVGALKILSTIDTTTLFTSTIGLIAVMSMLVATIKSLSSVAGANVGGVIKLATGVLMLTGSIMLLSLIDQNDLIKAGVALAGIFLAIGILYKSLSSDAKKFTLINASIIGLSLAILTVAGAMMMLSTIDSNAMATAFVGLAGIIALIVGPMLILSKINPVKLLATAAAFTIMAGALLILVTALHSMANLDLMDTLGGLVPLMILVSGLSALAYVMGGAIVTLAAFGAALALIGAGLLAISLAFQVFISTADKFGKVFKDIGTNIGLGFINFFVTVLDGLDTLDKKFLETISNIINNTLDWLIDEIPNIVVKVSTIILTILQSLHSTLPDLIGELISLVAETIEGVAVAIHDESAELATAIVDLVESVAELLANVLETALKKAFTWDTSKAIWNQGLGNWLDWMIHGQTDAESYQYGVSDEVSRNAQSSFVGYQNTYSQANARTLGASFGTTLANTISNKVSSSNPKITPVVDQTNINILKSELASISRMGISINLDRINALSSGSNSSGNTYNITQTFNGTGSSSTDAYRGTNEAVHGKVAYPTY